MKRINRWLTNNISVWHFSEKEGCFILWLALLTFLTLFAGHYILHNVTLYFQILCLGVSFLPPIILGIKSIITKTKLDLNYWFIALRGLVYGGLLACLVVSILRGVKYVILGIIELLG